MVNKSPAVLLLEDGIVMHGYAFGKKGVATGELCFTTAMTGYQETFTDPSYFGQVLIMNSVHVGNYGVNHTDTESGHVQVRGVICKNLEERYSRFLADKSLQEYFETQGIVAIHGVDTRALVAHVREKGAMNCIIGSDGTPVEKLREILGAVPNMNGLELASAVSTKQSYEVGDGSGGIHIAVLDFGVKKNILTCLADRGAYLKVFNARAGFDELNTFQPDGYFLSNGPGDPAPMHYAIDNVKKILESGKPVFGICLGHQLLALANGIPTFKMKNGHRGVNHPVKNVLTGLSEISTQNHGFGVNPEAVKKNNGVEVTHINLNDGSIEGIRLRGRPAFSVQYHPESTPGPYDSRYLFDDFINLVKENKK